MATLDDVKVWAIEKGVGHIVMSEGSGWFYNLCCVGPSFGRATERPKRICRKCRAMLAEATVIEKR
jgi:hypothetical protein